MNTKLAMEDKVSQTIDKDLHITRSNSKNKTKHRNQHSFLLTNSLLTQFKHDSMLPKPKSTLFKY